VTLTDAGPLVALINRNDPNHQKCSDAARTLPRGRLLSTWPCFTEARYLLHRAGGHPAQAALWLLRESGRLVLHNPTDAEAAHMSAMMAKYHDLPMDLADASLLAAGESLGMRRVFTIDQDVRVYRFSDGSAVEVVP
jgi:uncharacterized protein